MTGLWLIARREFRAYVATASFWIALLLGPVLVASATALLGAPPKTTPVAIKAADPSLRAALTASVLEAAKIENRLVAVRPDASVAASVGLTETGRVELAFSNDFPLSPSGRALAARTLEFKAFGPAGLRPTTSVVVRPRETASAPAADRVARFVVVMLFWLTLTGSLGMLLQAVVRERANRALELLLASVRPWQVVGGKVAGVGLVSLLVLATWLGSVWAAAAAGAGGQLLPLLQAAGDPEALARATVIYLFGYAFYGLTTVALGAAARDSAAAQNLARPMFATLLVAFFVAMSTVSARPGLDWLVYAPPFTPFLLLMREPVAAVDLPALALLASAATVAGLVAARRTQVVQGRSMYSLVKTLILNPRG